MCGVRTRTAYDIMRDWGCLAGTVAEQRAYVGVLARIGAFSSSERVTLTREGFLQSDGPQRSDGRSAHNLAHDDRAQIQGNRLRAA